MYSYLAVYTLNVTDGPALTISGATNVCSGKTASLAIAGANGNYTTSLGLTTGTLVFPVSSPTFVVIKGKNAYGCITQQTVNLVQIPSPTVSVNSGTICRGAEFTITPTGAATYSITQNKFIIQPAYSFNYTVTGMATNGCKANVVSTVAVIQPPNVSIVGPTLVCTNETYSLIAKNALAYEWYGGDTSRVLTFNSTPGNYFFVLTGVNDKGCKGTTSLQVKVSACEDLKEGANTLLKVYPSITAGNVVLEGAVLGTSYTLMDVAGQQILHDVIRQSRENIDLGNFPSGLYFIRIGEDTFKIIRQ